MTTKELYKELNYVNHSREKRLYYANLMLDNPNMIATLLDILFMVDDTISCRAAWVFEFLCGERLEACIPHLDRFTDNIHFVHLDPAVRPVAKICEYVITAHYSKIDNPMVLAVLPHHKEKITEACFDWMISKQKVAAKAYSMTTLFLLSRDYKWILPELKLILERDYQSQSAAYKARARRILKKINTQKS